MNLCDKCGQDVPRENDATQLDVEAGFMRPIGLFVMSARHLAPTDDCPGSPSRWQYLGGPPDPRYSLDEEIRGRYQEAYEQLRAKAS